MFVDSFLIGFGGVCGVLVSFLSLFGFFIGVDFVFFLSLVVKFCCIFFVVLWDRSDFCCFS